jgi:hypothetical protein
MEIMGKFGWSTLKRLKMNVELCCSRFILGILSVFIVSKCLQVSVGEFRKTRHPRNVKFDKVLETCFSGTGNSRFSEAWNL